MINDDDLLQDIKEAVEDIILSTQEVDENVLDIYNRLGKELIGLEEIENPTKEQKAFIRAAKNLNKQFGIYLNTRGILYPKTDNPKPEGDILCNTEDEHNKTDDDSEPKS